MRPDSCYSHVNWQETWQTPLSLPVGEQAPTQTNQVQVEISGTILQMFPGKHLGTSDNVAG
jgi:hypothetical protein